jgi:hypothetical protein
MKRSNAMSKKVSAWALALNILLILTLIPLVSFDSARAQDAAGETVESGTAQASPVGMETMQWSAEAPVLTAEQQAQLAYWAERTNLPGPARPGAELEAASVPAPAAETASNPLGRAPSPRAPLAPGDAQIYRKTLFGSVIPSGYKSNVMESSVAQHGKRVFYTGNWFAARSANDGGATWTYVNPFSGFADFCCDQVTTYDEARNAIFWLRMGIPNASGVNRFRLGVSNDGGATFCNYDFYPTNTNSGWTNQWWDYPHIQLGADYLYLAWNMFNASGNWVRTVMLRLPLDALRNCAGFSYNYYWNTGWFTFVPVQGADHTMYFASNYPLASPFNRLSIWRWDENTTTINQFIRTITAWAYTSRNQAICGSTTNNWAARTDDRLLSGARYKIQGSNLMYRGREVLAWWWNVKQGGGFVNPYVDAAAFFEDTLVQVSGGQGRPYVWSSAGCWLYPSFASNQRGDLGFIIHGAFDSYKRPDVYIGLADDYWSAPPGFPVYLVQESNARPLDKKWGDYNTTRVFAAAQDTWTAASHYIPGSSACTNCSAPVFVNFGRNRDYKSWFRWYNK